MRAHLSRWVCQDAESNLSTLREEADMAASSGAQLAIFPELFLQGYTRSVDPSRARSSFTEVSSAWPRTLFVFGSFVEEGRNRMTLWQSGREVARYDKVHLFRPNREHELWVPGDRYGALRWGDLTLGLLNCNDIRFPEQARMLRLEAGCDMLVVVGWWPWRRDHVWSALMRARAIENGVWVLGCCVNASRFPGEDFAGAGNHVFDPQGEAVRTPDDRTYDLDLERGKSLLVDPMETHVAIQTVQLFESY